MQVARRMNRHRFETLEPRCLLAGDVSYSLVDGTLTLMGDAEDNAILITTSSEGVVRIEGLVKDGKLTTIDDDASRVFSGVQNIAIAMDGFNVNADRGDDAVVIGSLSLTGWCTIETGSGDDFVGIGDFVNDGYVDSAVDGHLGDTSILGGLAIDVRGGSNVIIVENVTIGDSGLASFAIGLGQADNSVSLARISVTKETSIASAGSAAIHIEQVSFKSLSVEFSSGNDQLSIAESTLANHLSVVGDFGDDLISLTDVGLGSLEAVLGNGNDSLSLVDVDITHGMIVRAEQGSDSVALSRVEAASIGVFLGMGDDSISLDEVEAGQDIEIRGGKGSDAITLTGVEANAILAGAGIGDDSIAMSGIAAQSLRAYLYYGADTMTLTNVDVGKRIDLGGGAGNDLFGIDHVSAGSLRLHMGQNDDQLTLDEVDLVFGAELRGGRGHDSMQLSGLTAKSMAVYLGMGADHLNASNIDLTMAASVETYDGADTVVLEDLAAKSLSARLGRGDDQISLKNILTSDDVFLGGGFGNDQFTDLGGNTFGSFSHNNIESTV